MKTYASLFLVWAVAGCAQAEGEGLSAGQSAMAARAIAHAYTVQPPQDVVQIYQGNGHPSGAGVNMNLSIGSYYSNGTGQAPRENIVNLRDVVQICMHC